MSRESVLGTVLTIGGIGAGVMLLITLIQMKEPPKWLTKWIDR
jgi:hypothetical protein